MRVLATAAAASALFLFVGPGPVLAQSHRIACSQIPKAQHYVDGLKPGPNTSAAQAHLDAAKAATSDRQCVAELRKTDYYAKRSAAADRRAAMPHHVRCADLLHQNRPGGTAYNGPPVPGCRPVHI